MDKPSSVHWYNTFINRRQLLLLCVKTRTIALLLLVLMVGRLVDKIVLNLEICTVFEIIYWTKLCSI